MNNMHKSVLGIDIGSSNMKLSLLGANGQVLGTSSRELQTSYLNPGWAEQSPEDWWTALCQCCEELFLIPGINKKDLAGICVTAATHTPVLIDKDDKVLRPAILWTDTRSTEEVMELNRDHGDRIFEISYHKASPTWTLPQLKWLSKNEPEIVEKTERHFTAKDYLRYLLTGDWITDYADAQGTLMFDQKNKCWSEELCSFIGWPMHTLPPIGAAMDVAGTVSKEAAGSCGLPEGVPVIIGSSDTALEYYGAGAISYGQSIFKIATAGNTAVMCPEPYPHPALFNYLHPMPDMWYVVAATLSGAQVHRWFRNEFFPGLNIEGKDAFAIIEEKAMGVPTGSDGLLFHPYFLGEKSPYMDPYLRGDYLGITIRHTAGHFVKALYEGISFSLLDCMNVFGPLGVKLDEIRLIGGGAKSPLWRQILCDIIGKEILIPENSEAAFGAAVAAGVALGLFTSHEQAIEKCVRISSTNIPDPANHERYCRLFELYTESQRALHKINHKLYEFETGKNIDY